MADLESKVADLEKNVQSLNNTAKIIIAVAVIFGISGAWGLRTITSAKSQITELEERLTSVKAQFDTASNTFGRIRISNEELFDTHVQQKMKNFTMSDQQRIMASMPRGVIVAWFSKSIPDGWLLCDGKNGTPNLIERLPLGTSTNTHDLGSFTGDSSHSHSVKGQTAFEHKRKDKRDGNGFQGEGGQCMFHTHEIDITTSVANNMPPATRIIFIMKR